MTVKELVKKLKLIHVAVALGMSVLAAIVYFIVYSSGAMAPDWNLSYEISAIIIVFVLLVASMLVNKRQLKNISAELSLKDKLLQYRKANIVHYAFLEGIVFSLSILYLLSGLNNVFLYAMLGIVYFIYHRPHPMKLINEMDLDETEEEEIRSSF